MASITESSKTNESTVQNNVPTKTKRKVTIQKKTKTSPTVNNDTKSKFISKIPVPNVVSSNEENGLMKFTVESINVSVINALRRTILSDIPVIVFDTLSKDSINISKILLYLITKY